MQGVMISGQAAASAPIALEANTTYFWRIRESAAPALTMPLVAPYLSCWRPAQSFKTGGATPAPISPITLGPGKSPPVHPWSIEFKYSQIAQATAYNVQIARSNDPKFNSPIADVTFKTWKPEAESGEHAHRQPTALAGPGDRSGGTGRRKAARRSLQCARPLSHQHSLHPGDRAGGRGHLPVAGQLRLGTRARRRPLRGDGGQRQRQDGGAAGQRPDGALSQKFAALTADYSWAVRVVGPQWPITNQGPNDRKGRRRHGELLDRRRGYCGASATLVGANVCVAAGAHKVIKLAGSARR